MLGLGSLAEAVPFAVTTAGYALVPDLDCHGATASRLLGPITGVLSRLLGWASKRLYQATRGPQDEGGADHGGHRHLTHCLLWCLLLGITAGLTSTLSPWVTLGWVVFGVLAATEALGDRVFLAAAAAVTVPLLSGGASETLAAMSGWIGLAAGVGCLVHIGGDMCTVSGCPLLFPLVIRGESWQELHLLPRGWRLSTGKEGPLRVRGAKFEKTIVFPVFALAAVVAFVLLPEVRPAVRAVYDTTADLFGRGEA